MKITANHSLAIAGFVLLAATTSFAVAQIGSEKKSPPVTIDVIPAEVLKTDEGQNLAHRLRILRRSEAGMGEKHPGRAGVQAEIQAIRGQLGLHKSGRQTTDIPSGMSLNSMTDENLRQLMQRMALRIESLEQRVEALERRLEVF